MRKSLLSLLVVATVIATILVAGCTSSTSPTPSPQVVSTSNSSTTATTSSSSEASSVSPSPSASASPTPTATPTATPTPTSSPTATPQPSGKTSIALGPPVEGGPLTSFQKGEPINWDINVVSQVTGTTVCGGTVTVSIAGITTTQSTSAPGCFHTAYFSLNSGISKDGTYKVTLSYSGSGTLQPSENTFDITVSG